MNIRDQTVLLIAILSVLIVKHVRTIMYTNISTKRLLMISESGKRSIKFRPIYSRISRLMELPKSFKQ